MKKWTLTIWLGMAMTGPLYADDLSAHTGLFANAKEVFRPLLADPREVQLALRLVTPVSRKNLGDIAVGEYFGLSRWALPWQDSYLQWSIAGGIFARFDLVSDQKDSQVIDYTANMPFDLRVKKWSLRVMPYHISSHLGDDFIKRTGILPDKYSFDSYKTLIAYEPCPYLRLYGGSNYIIRNSKDYLGRYAVQTGMEWTSGWWAHNHAQLFWATDFQSWERIAWNPIVNTQLGVRIANHPDDKQMLSIFTEYGAGHMSYGQLFQQQESHWVLGLRFDIP
jgi:hypothetical protein